jgi:hypothetical protein
MSHISIFYIVKAHNNNHSNASLKDKGGKWVLYHVPTQAKVNNWPTQVEGVEMEHGENEHIPDLFAEGNMIQVEVTTSDPTNPSDAAKANGMAAIPEAPTPPRRSKRRADTTDQISLERTKRMKSAHNMDVTAKQGNKIHPEHSFLHLTSDEIHDNLKEPARYMFR